MAALQYVELSLAKEQRSLKKLNLHNLSVFRNRPNSNWFSESDYWFVKLFYQNVYENVNRWNLKIWFKSKVFQICIVLKFF